MYLSHVEYYKHTLVRAYEISSPYTYILFLCIKIVDYKMHLTRQTV